MAKNTPVQFCTGVILTGLFRRLRQHCAAFSQVVHSSLQILHHLRAALLNLGGICFIHQGGHGVDVVHLAWQPDCIFACASA